MANFASLRPGLYVLCGATGVAIALEELRYWSVELQEPYSGPEAVLIRLNGRSGL